MQLHDKIQYVLDESRILILGAQVLVGFHYRAAFERGFQHLPETSQALLLGALGLTGDCFVVVRKVTSPRYSLRPSDSEPFNACHQSLQP